MAARKPGRPPKHVGLAIPASLKKVVDGDELRDLREPQRQPEGPVLPETPAADAPPVRGQRLFGTTRRDDASRGATPLVPPVLNAPGREDRDLSFTDYLKKIATEIVPGEFAEYGEQMTGLEMLARKVFYAALQDNMGAQRARELVVDRLEGKAVRAAQVERPDSTIEDQIDAAAVAALNSLAAPEKKEDSSV